MKLIHYGIGAKRAISVFIPHLGCPNLCVFCNQNSISSTRRLPTAEEIENSVRTALKNGRSPQDFELAFFGGSFTSIDRSVMNNYLSIAEFLIDHYGLFGLRVSARPDGIDEAVLALLKKARVSTIEIGAQSMNDAVLTKSGRGHTSADVRSAAKLIKDSGIGLVLQMMTGLPEDTDEGALHTAKEMITLVPNGVRIYPLLVLKNTPLEKEFRNKNYIPQTLSDTVELCAKIATQFYENGIPIVKLGLHANANFSNGEMIAGPYHEAFGELVDGKIIRDAAELATENRVSIKELTVRCSTTDISKAIGHKRENVLYFEKKSGISLKVIVGELPSGVFDFYIS